MRHSPGGGELLDTALIDEGGYGPLEDWYGCVGPDVGPLSLDRLLRGGILEGLVRHEGVFVGSLGG